MIGARLKLARAAAGLSLRDLAARAGVTVTAQAIGKYERDEMMPSSPVLIGLARALAVPADYLLRESRLEVAHIEFRRKSLLRAREEASVKARVLDAVERYREVEAYLAMIAEWTAPRGFPRSVVSADDAERAASDLRRAWNIGLDPIPDICALLEEHHVKVQVMNLPDEVSGLHAEVTGGAGKSTRIVVVNASHAGERQRFTLAHELGHLLMEVPGGKPGERLCQRFASAFLMPGDALVREVGRRRHALPVRELFRLKTLFGVSAQAVAYRCRDLEIISNPAFVSIFTHFGRQKWRQKEPNPLASEKPLRFERLVIRALAENAIGEAKAAELLGLSTWQLIEMLDTPPAESDDDIPAGGTLCTAWCVCRPVHALVCPGTRCAAESSGIDGRGTALGRLPANRKSSDDGITSSSR